MIKYKFKTKDHKYLLVILFIININTTIAQSFINNVEGVWLSDTNIAISINLKNCSIYNHKGEYKDYLKLSYRETDSIIIFKDHYNNFATNTQKTSQYIFKLIENNSCKMKIVAKNDLAINFLNEKDTLSFSRIKKPIIKNTTFEVLLFSGQEDFYNYYIKIDKDKNFEMIKKPNQRNRSEDTSYYKGKIDKYFFNQIINKIELSNLKNLNYEITTLCGSCSSKSLIVEFKNKIFKHKDFGLSPIILKDLVDYLVVLSKSYKLKETTNKLYFDNTF